MSAENPADARLQTCGGCGAVSTRDEGEPPVGDHCRECPPGLCEDCFQLWTHENPCECVIQLDGMTLADLKALFAHGDLSLDPGKAARDDQ